MLRRTILLGAFFLAGFSSLVYEIVWLRQLSLIFGSTVYAVSIVLAAFMGGLALGSAWLGRIADRSAVPLRRYAVVQVLAGLSALGSSLLIPSLASVYPLIIGPGPATSLTVSIVTFGLSVVLVALPTTFMGGSFPLMVRAYLACDGNTGRGVGLLYGVNTLGSALGAIVTAFLLIGSIGLFGAVGVAAVLNLGSGAVFFMPRPRPSDLGPGPAAPGSFLLTSNLVKVLTIFIGLSGFAALGYEVFWTRLLSIFLQNTVYSFAIVLSAVLAGIAIGSFLYSRFVARRGHPVLQFARLQILLGLYVLTLHLSLPGLPSVVAAALGGSGVSWGLGMFFQFALLLVIFLPATVIMGILLPLVIATVGRQSETIGIRAGFVYSLNTVGAILGSLIAGFVLLPLLGTQFGMKLLAWVNIGIGISMLFLAINRRWPLTTVLVGLALVLTVIPGRPILPPTVFTGLGRSFRLLFYKETVSGTVTAVEETATKIRSCYVNNSAVCGTTYDALKVVRMLGALPMLLHPDPHRVLVIGFGIGITASTAARFTTGSLDCVEICPAVAQAADYFSAYNEKVLHNPRVRLIKGDGRNYLLLTRDKYDVISCDPTHPLLGCGALYTREFFELCRRRLNPGGVVCQYLPLHKISLSDFEAILRTFHDVFPNASLWIGFSHAVMAGRVEPGAIDYASLARRSIQPAVQSALAPVNLGTPAELLGCLILDQVAVGRFVLGSRINTDQHPVVEFSGPRSLGRPTWPENMSALLNFRSDPASAITNIAPETLATVRMIQAAKSFLYRGMVKQELGLFREAFDEYSAGRQLNPQDVELRMMIDRVAR